MSDRARPGQVLTITSHANPRIKAIKALAQAKYRKETGQFLVEGLKLVTDALEKDWPVRTVIHQADAMSQPAVANAAATARARGADILAVSADILGKIARRDNPQMVLGVVDQRLASADDLAKAGPVLIALERIKDPGNLGTIIRTADAVGAGGVCLVGPSVDPFSLEAVRATMGSIFHVPLARLTEEEFAALRAKWPGSVVGTHLSGAVDYRSANYREPVLLLMGNEQSGLTDEAAALCDELVRIPMVGQANSLNLAVSTAVMLYEIRRNQLIL